MKKVQKTLVSLLSVGLLAACGNDTANDSATNEADTSSNDAQTEEFDIETASFDEIIEEADGTTVTFYGWGGDELLNNWLDDVYAPHMKENYNIDMERVGMDIEDILSQLTNEKQAGEEEGAIDMIWINGENFKTAHENDFLFGPFAEDLPNFEEYVDGEDPEHQYDFGYPIDGYEVPYGKAQLVMMGDSAKIDEFPTTTDELKEFVEANPGQVTYPAPPDFTGSAFVRTIISAFVDIDELMEMPEDKEVVKETIQPALDYLNEIEPYLWNEGKSYPSESPQVENMFADGELLMYQSYGAFDAALGIEDGRYPETTETFVFDSGTVGNTNFMAIANNSTNKAGAMVAINEMISPEMQLSRYEELKVIPVIDNSTLSEEQQEAFNNVEIGPGVVEQDVLLDNRLPEVPAGLVPIIEEIWLEEVAGS